MHGERFQKRTISINCLTTQLTCRYEAQRNSGQVQRLVSPFPLHACPSYCRSHGSASSHTDDGKGGFLIHLLSKNQPVTLPDPAPCLQKPYIPRFAGSSGGYLYFRSIRFHKYPQFGLNTFFQLPINCRIFTNAFDKFMRNQFTSLVAQTVSAVGLSARAS